MFQSIKYSIREVDNTRSQTIKTTLLFRYARIQTALGSLGSPMFDMESLWHWWKALHQTHSFYYLHYCQKNKENSSCCCWLVDYSFFPLITQNWWSSCHPGLCQHSAMQCAEVFCKAVACLSMLQISDLLHSSCCPSFLNQNQWKQKSGLNRALIDCACHCIVITGWRERKVLALRDTSSRFSRTSEVVLNLSLLLW